MTIEFKKRPAYLLGLREISAWQLKDPVPIRCQPLCEDHDEPIFAELPALQRGSVWSAVQTEALWDSLVRGFPVGSFFFAPYQKGFGSEEFKLGAGSCSVPDYLLLDGQQRATAIALGFLDVWIDSDKYADGPALWVDLAPAKDGERDFVFRLLTRSHPWGYARDDPKKRLAQGDIRDALECFRAVGGVDASAAKLPLRYAWPWDATCPMPVALLLASVGATDLHSELLRRLQALPMWSDLARLQDGSGLVDRWSSALDDLLKEDKSSRLMQLMNALRMQLEIARIPALVLPADDVGGGSEALASDARKDAVETLFVRVNSAGTPLAGEELIYSSLKAAWPDAPKVLKKLQPENRQLVTPARLVSLLWRLHSAFPEENNRASKTLPAIPSVSDFRKAMRNSEKRRNFECFVNNPNHQLLLHDLLDWVRLGGIESVEKDTDDIVQTSRNVHASETWRLPPTLAAQLFAGDRGLDILFIAVAWIKCLQYRSMKLTQLTPLQRQRSLGFIVAIHWFAERPADCVSGLWKQMLDCDDLYDFFNADRFRSLLPARDDGSMVMLPMIPPKLLEGVISRRVIHGANVVGDFWKPGSNWSHFYGQLAPEPFSKLDEELGQWLKTLNFGYSASDEDDMGSELDASQIEVTREVKLRQAWQNVLDKTWSHRPLIDYAQREWLANWFPDFDPTMPGQMDDLNRPWDYDHIHPSKFGGDVRNLPAVIREWHQSIGNLRAWPLELNRGDQADSPAEKLSVTDVQTAHFGMTKFEDLLRASFIDESSEWGDWQATFPTPLVNHRYLALPGSDDQRQALLRVITSRFCRLYREWYENLAIGNLMPQ